MSNTTSGSVPGPSRTTWPPIWLQSSTSEIPQQRADEPNPIIHKVTATTLQNGSLKSSVQGEGEPRERKGGTKPSAASDPSLAPTIALTALIDWFRANRGRLPAAPFEIGVGRRVVNSNGFYKSLDREIAKVRAGGSMTIGMETSLRDVWTIVEQKRL